MSSEVVQMICKLAETGGTAAVWMFGIHCLTQILKIGVIVGGIGYGLKKLGEGMENVFRETKNQ